MTTAAIYLRKSHKVKGTNKQHQRQACMDFATAQGWDVQEYNEPQGYTGWDLDRPVWAQMVDDGKAGKVHTVVAYEQSRVGRNIDIMSEAQRQIAPLNIYFVAEGTTSNAEAGTDERLRYNLNNLIYEQEHANTKRRMMAEKDLKRKAGEIFVGSPPYGYRYAGNKRFEVDPDTAPIVQRIYRLYLQGHSIKQIAATLVAEGATTSRVSKEDRAKGVIPIPSTPTTVSKILQRDVYVTGQIVRNQHVHKKVGNVAPILLDEQGNPVLKPQDEWITYTMEPLVTQEDWDAVKRKKDANRTKSRRGRRGNPEKMAQFWLRNTMRCAHCGSAMKPRTQHNNGITYKYYTCHYSRCSKADLIAAKKQALCPLPTIKADDVHSRVWDDVHAALVMDDHGDGVQMYPPYNAKKLGPVINSAEYDKKLAAIRKRITTTQRELEGTTTTIELNRKNLSEPGHDEDDRVYFRRALNDAKARKNQLTEQLRLLEVDHQQVADDRDDDKLRTQLAEYGPIVLAQVALKLHELKAPDKKRLVEAMVDDAILIDGKKGPRGGRRNRGSLWNIKAMDLKPGRALGVLSELRAEGKLDIDSVHGAGGGKHVDLINYLEDMYRLAA